MKKLFVIVLALVLSLTAFSACAKPAEPKTGEAYSSVHGAKYTGKATVTVLDGKVTGATLEEACFPDQVPATDAIAAEDKVTMAGKYSDLIVYKTVKFAGKTAIADNEGYKVYGVALGVWVLTEANAKMYYDAVEKNEVSVMVGGAEKKDIMTAKTLIKSLNGYGKPNFDWVKNQKATIDYVVKNGFDVADSLTYDKDAKTWTDSKGVVATGATWSDMNTKKPEFSSYIKLLTDAYNKVK